MTHHLKLQLVTWSPQEHCFRIQFCAYLYHLHIHNLIQFNRSFKDTRSLLIINSDIKLGFRSKYSPQSTLTSSHAAASSWSTTQKSVLRRLFPIYSASLFVLIYFICCSDFHLHFLVLASTYSGNIGSVSFCQTSVMFENIGSSPLPLSSLGWWSWSFHLPF